MSFSFNSLKRVALLAAAVVPVAFISGCTMSTTAPATNSFTSAGVLSGNLHGGNQPITNATVTLYEAGTAGYGSAGTLIATTTSDSSSSFSFNQVASSGSIPVNGIIDSTKNTYACPASGDPQMYVVAKGGNTVGTSSNSSAAFIVAIGDCQNAASKFATMNEVTTVATLAALQQYFNPVTDSFGYNNTTQSALGFTNGVATIANLADIAGGAAVTSKTLTGTASTVSGTTVTVTPETSKINTIADILAACVNTVSSSGTPSGNCNTLFTNAVPPASAAITSQPAIAYTAATDTLQAAYYMLVNPTESQDNSTTSGKMFNLYSLVGGAAAPFQPTLSAQPTDWTIGILYLAGSQIGTAAPGNTPSQCSGTASAGAFIFYPYLIRADASGNLWMVSNGPAGAANKTPSISELSPTGLPLACVQPGATQGLFEGLTIDTAGNIWAASHVTGGGIFKVDPTNLTTTNWVESGTEPWDIQADGSGNIFYTVASAPVRKFTGAATASTPAAATAIGTASNPVQNYMVLDPSGNVFVGDNTTGAQSLFETYPSASGTNGYSTYTAGTLGNIQAQLAVDASGKVWAGLSTTNTVSIYTPQTPPTPATVVTTAAAIGGLSTARGVAIDGAGNAWIANGVANKITELDKNANALSPTGTGFTKTLFSQTMRGVTVDPSGNVWIADNVTSQSVIQEIVGAGVPVVTPLSAQLAAGTVAKP